MKKELKFFDEEHVGGLNSDEIIKRLLEMQKKNGRLPFHTFYITSNPIKKKAKKNKEKV